MPKKQNITPEDLTEEERSRRQSAAKVQYDAITIRQTYLRQAVSICGSGDLYRITRFCDWVAANALDIFWIDEPEVVTLAFCYFRLVEFLDLQIAQLTAPEVYNINRVRLAIYEDIARRGELNLITGED